MTQGKYEIGRRPAYPAYAPTDKTRSVYHRPEEIHAYQAKHGARPHFVAQAQIGGMAMNCRCSKCSVENSFSHTKRAVNEKANSIQLVDHTELFQALVYFIADTAWVGKFIKKDIEFLEENYSRVVDGDQGMINQFHTRLDNGSLELYASETRGWNLQQGPDGFNNFLCRVAQQLRDFQSSNLVPTETVSRAVKYYMDEENDWRNRKAALCHDNGRNPVFMPYAPSVPVSIKVTDINYIATEYQYNWALSIGINGVGTVRTNLAGIRTIYDESSLFSVKTAMSNASADNGFKLRFNIRNARGRAESFLSFLDSVDMVNLKTDVKMRGCF